MKCPEIKGALIRTLEGTVCFICIFSEGLMLDNSHLLIIKSFLSFFFLRRFWLYIRGIVNDRL